VIAETTPCAVAGLLHLPHYLPMCKGPVLAAISADEFRPRRNYFSSSARSIFSRAEFSQRSFATACDASGLLSVKGRFSARFRTFARKKDAQTRQGTVEGGSGQTREYAK